MKMEKCDVNNKENCDIGGNVVSVTGRHIISIMIR